MTLKFDPMAKAPALMQAWLAASQTIAASLEPSLVELVRTRASQIGGPADGPAMRDAPCYTARERAALAWTDALARMSGEDAREAAYEGIWSHFSAEDQVALTLLINVACGWDRLAVGFGVRLEPLRQTAA